MKLRVSLPFRAAVASAAILASCSPGVAPDVPDIHGGTGRLIHSERSRFSNIRIRESGSVRSLYFVEPGLEVRQTSVDLAQPGNLLVPYTRTMFATFLLNDRQQRVLVVGLGGGSMVRFLNHHFPRTEVDAVEIDPAVVRIARDYFGTKPGPGTRIFTEDAIRYLRRDVGTYDAIYMDAFLEPGPDTDPRGIPQHLKTLDFLKGLHRRLRPGGVVAFNLVEHPGLQRDLGTLSEAFGTVLVFRVPGTKNLTVIATPDSRNVSSEGLRARGRLFDRRHNPGFSLETIVDRLQR